MLYFFCTSLYALNRSWTEFDGTAKIGNCLERMMNFNLFGDGLVTLPRLRISNNCDFGVMADVSFSRYEADTHLQSAPEYQTGKRSVTPFD